MANITRIKNNQITDSTITYAKIASGTLVGTNFNANLTLNSNVTILGNLTVAGTPTTLNSVNTYISDPLVVFNNGYSGTPSYDVGMVINRALYATAPYGSVNAAFVWKEADTAFEALMTTEVGSTTGAINNSGYANVKMGNTTIVTGTVSNSLTVGTTLGVTGTSTLGVVNTSGVLTSTANVVAASGTTSTSTTTGALTVVGGAGVSGNVYVGQAVIATGGTVSTGTFAGAYSDGIIFDYVNNMGRVSVGAGDGLTIYNGGLANTALLAITSLGNVTATGNLIATTGIYGASLNLSGALAAGSIVNTPISGSTGYFTTAQATNFSSGNILVTGGSLSGITNLNVTTETATNFASGNAQITGGSVTGITALSATTAQATNFSSGNAVITGGSANGLTTFSGTTGQATNFSTGNILVTGGSLSGITNLNVTTETATNFASGNAQITGGAISGTPISGSTGYFTTAQATNFSSANALITTGAVTNFATGNAQITGGSLSGITNLNATTAQATNFSSGNILVTGGSLSGIANFNVTTGTIANFASGNAVITGGSLNGTSVGATTASTGVFTTLIATSTAIANGNIVANSGTASTNTTTGALVVKGGVGISGAVNIGGDAKISGNLEVDGTLTYINTTTEVVSGVEVVAGNLVANSGTASSSTTTGALVVAGGFGISGAINSGGAVNTSGVVSITNATATTGSGTGALQVSGGAYVAGNINVGGSINALTGTTASTSTSTGVLVLSGGLGVAGNINGGGSTNVLTGSLNAGSIINTPISGSTGYFTTAQATNFSSGNILVTGGTLSGITNLNATTLQATNFSSGNILITGGTLSGITAFNGTTATIANFASGNAVITGGSINATPIGASSASTGAFTTLTNSGVHISSGNIVAASGTPSTSTTTGALVIAGTGGLAVGGNLNVGVYNSSYHKISGNLLLGQGAINATTLDTILTINENTDTPIVSNATVHLSGTTGKSAIYGADSFGTTVGSIFYTRKARGTSASPTAAQQGDGLGYFIGRGYGATGYNFAATAPQASGLGIYASENYTDTAQGTFLTLSTVNNGATLANVAVKVEQNGNVVITAGTPSTTTNTGALVVLGGVGMIGALNVAGTSTFGSTTLHNANVVINSGADSVSTTTGALVIPNGGGAAITGNVYVGNNLYIGGSAYSQTFANPTIIAVDSGINYAQMALKNTAASGSADYAAYVDIGTDAGGWVDMGIAGSSFADGNYTITKPQDGYVIIRPTSNSYGGNLVLGTSEAGSYNDVTISVGSFFANAEVARFHGNTNTSGTLTVKLPTNNTMTANTGALQLWGGASISGNVYHGGAALFNGSQSSNYDVLVRGVNDTSLVWARPNTTYDSVIIGGSASPSTFVRGAKLAINSTDSLLLPVGTTAQQPGNSGGTNVQGMLRFNSSLPGMEVYNGTAWQAFTTSFTVIVDAQFTASAAQTSFTLSTISALQTTASCIVSINGVVQIPSLAYSVNGSTAGSQTVDFTEGLVAGDVVDVRCLTTTVTVGTITSTNGYMAFQVDNYGANITTGSASQVVTTSWNPAGAQVSFVPNVAVASANTATTIDTIDNTQYRSAKYVVQVTNGANYQVQEVLVISNGTTATSVTYGTLQTNGNLGVVQATQSGSNTLIQFVAANATNNVRIKKDYLAL